MNGKQLIFSVLSILFFSATSFAQMKKNINTATANKKMLLHIVEELFNKGDTTIADKYFAADFANEEKAFTNLIRTAFSDLVIKADIIVAENNIVAVRWIATGTHRGVFLGVQPTGKFVSWKGSWFWTFKNGKIIDGMGKGSWDALGLLKQLQTK